MEEKRDHKIYVYTNKVNGKVYVGRTCNSLRRRAGRDGGRYKNCSYFWRAIQKYGWENFEGEIIEENLNDKEATERENFYIKKFNSADRKFGYNIQEDRKRSFSDSSRNKLCNKIVSEETRKKISKNHADVSGENNPMWGRHRTPEEKARLRQASLGRIHSREACESMSRKHAGRIPWNKGKKMSEEQIKNYKNKKSYSKKSVTCIETGEVYESVMAAERALEISASCIRRACNKGKTAKGYHWKWTKDSYSAGRKIKCVETGIEFLSIKEACEVMGLKQSALSSALRLRHASGGYHWEYVNESD